MSQASETTPLVTSTDRQSIGREEYGEDEVPHVPDSATSMVAVKLPTVKFVLVITALYSGTILAAIDATVMTTLMGHIASELKQLDNISWAATGYTVAYSAFQPLYGKLSDIVGRKTVLLSTLSVFAVGCFMCGIAKSLTMLVAGRFVSGIGAGGMLSVGSITMSDFVPLRSRGVFQGIGNICFGSGAALGGVFGSYFTNRAGWRWAFLAQVPVAVIVAALYILCIPNFKVDGEQEMQGERHTDHPIKRNSLERIDVVGSSSLVTALLLSMLAVTTGGNQFPWFSLPIFGFIASSAVALYLFWWWEVNRAIEPVMPVELMTHRTIVAACFANFFGSGYAFAFLYYCPIFLQSTYHYDYTVISHRITVNFVGVATGSLGTGMYMRHTGKYWGITVGTGLLMVCSATLYLIGQFLPGHVDASPYYQSFAYFVGGAGYAGMLTSTLMALLSSVPYSMQATTTSAQYMFRGAGSSIGIAAAAAVFNNVLTGQLTQNVHGKHAAEIISKVAQSVEAIWDIPEKYLPGVLLSYNRAGLATFGLCVVLGALCLISSILLKENVIDRH